MNYRLSIGVNRPIGKKCFVLERKGMELDSKILSNSSRNIKIELLSVLAKGLMSCRSYVKHEDILYIELQNREILSWLSGLEEYKGYEDELDSVYEILESLDCRYSFLFIEKPYALGYINKNKKTDVKGSSISDLDFN